MPGTRHTNLAGGQVIQINLCQPSSIILADLGRHVIMDSFLQAVLRAGGVELQWEYLGEVAANEEGVMVYVSLGRRLTKVEFVGQLTGGTLEYAAEAPSEELETWQTT